MEKPPTAFHQEEMHEARKALMAVWQWHVQGHEGPFPERAIRRVLGNPDEVCPQCLSFRPGDQRVKAGMTCRFCDRKGG